MTETEAVAAARWAAEARMAEGWVVVVPVGLVERAEPAAAFAADRLAQLGASGGAAAWVPPRAEAAAVGIARQKPERSARSRQRPGYSLALSPPER